MHPEDEIPIMERIIYLLIMNGIGCLLPVLVTMWCYYQVYCTLKEIEYIDPAVKPTRVLWYALIQILCFFPEMIIDIIFTLLGTENPFAASIISYVPKRFWGVLNLLAYWFLNTANEHRKSTAVFKRKTHSEFSLNDDLIEWDEEEREETLEI